MFGLLETDNTLFLYERSYEFYLLIPYLHFNKAVYASPVAPSWLKINYGPTDGSTNDPTDGWTDSPNGPTIALTDRHSAYGVA